MSYLYLLIRLVQLVAGGLTAGGHSRVTIVGGSLGLEKIFLRRGFHQAYSSSGTIYL